MKKLFISAVVALLCVSCRTTMMGPSFVLCRGQLEELNGASVGQERVSATASEHAFILSHLVVGEAAPQRAVEAAVAQGGENCIGLSEAFITARFVWWIPLLYTRYTYTAEGTPVYRREQK